MSKKTTLHPSVHQFKQFVKKHPLLIKEVRVGKKTWQDFFEEWTILGEKDEIWEKYRKVSNDQEEEDIEDDTEDEGEANEKKGSQIGDLLSMLKGINLNDIQGHVQNLSGMMTTVQGLLQSFQSNSSNDSGQGQQQGQPAQQGQQGQQTPFNFRQF